MDLSLQVGKYDVQRALGKGATGMVYLAKDTFTGGVVALKTIEPEVFRDPEFGTVYRSPMSCRSRSSAAGRSNTPPRKASSTATSSPRTSCWRKAPRLRSRISARL